MRSNRALETSEDEFIDLDEIGVIIMKKAIGQSSKMNDQKQK